MPEKVRVAIIVSHPIQHFVHFYRALSQEPQIELLVMYASDIGVRNYFDKDMGVEIEWKIDLLSGYRFVFLDGADKISDTKFKSINNSDIHRQLNEFSPQVVKLHGYAQLTLLKALAWCKLKRVPVLLWSDSELLRRRTLVKRVLKQLVLRPLLALFSGFLTTGDSNENYFRKYGINPKRMFRTPFTIDEKSFQSALNNKVEIRKRLRDKLFIKQEGFVVLVVGKLTEGKRPNDVVKSLLKIYETREEKNIYVVFTGDGKLRSYLVKLSEPISQYCKILGFINIDVLPEYYVMADVLAHVSEVDAHPLTNSEAVFVGLPLIVSNKLGTVGKTDLARPGKNAIVCPCGDIESISVAITQIADDAELYERIHKESLRISEEINNKSSVLGFLEAIKSVVK